MFREYFLLFLLGHVLGDFYLQTKGMAEMKEKNIKWVLLHSLCYFGTMILVGLPIISYKIILAIILASILHLIIDTFKYIYLGKRFCRILLVGNINKYSRSNYNIVYTLI